MIPELQNLPWNWPQIEKYVAKQVAAATERAEKAEAEFTRALANFDNAAMERDDLDKKCRTAREQIVTLTEELERAQAFRVNMEHAYALDREDFTRELEAERAASAAKDADLAAMREALEKLTGMLAVGENSGIPQLEINGIPAFRPIEPRMRDELGTLFTHLFNARVALSAAKLKRG